MVVPTDYGGATKPATRLCLSIMQRCQEREEGTTKNCDSGNAAASKCPARTTFAKALEMPSRAVFVQHGTLKSPANSLRQWHRRDDRKGRRKRLTLDAP